jgi:hypothetical protein
MEDEEVLLVRAIKASMAEGSRPAFDDKDIEHLGVLIRLTVQFYYFLTSRGRWPVFPEDPLHNTTYAIGSIFSGIDSFLTLTLVYGMLVGATTTTIDWNTITAQSLRDRFLSIYQDFSAESNFEKKCRLLLDLFKLQIVFAGMFYDCEG